MDGIQGMWVMALGLVIGFVIGGALGVIIVSITCSYKMNLLEQELRCRGIDLKIETLLHGGEGVNHGK